MNVKILLVEDDKVFANAFKITFQLRQIDVVWASTGAKAISEFKSDPHGFAVVVIDYELPDLKGSEVCQALRRMNPDQEFLFSTGHERLDYLTDILETGTDGFFAKGKAGADVMADRILARVAKYQTRSRVIGLDNYVVSQAEAELAVAGFKSRSKSMYAVLKQTDLYSTSPYSVLVVGETGVGKDLVAHALTPKGKTLITVNCATYLDKENLLESELFGHVKGAFTGADQNTVGLIMQAHNNVLFLDELHLLSLHAQAKLLRFLEVMKFRKVGDGSGKEISVNFKLIAAVQPDIRARVEDGRFMRDLIGRVSALVIQVPPLRERPDDIEPLVRKYQDEFNFGKSADQRKHVIASTIEAMTKLPWEQNVRTLSAMVRQLLTDCPTSIVEPIHLRKYLDSHFLNDHSAKKIAVHTHGEAKQKFESQLFIDALVLSTTRSEAAKRLGMPLSTFTRRLKELGIVPELYLKSSASEIKETLGDRSESELS